MVAKKTKNKVIYANSLFSLAFFKKNISAALLIISLLLSTIFSVSASPFSTISIKTFSLNTFSVNTTVQQQNQNEPSANEDIPEETSKKTLPLKAELPLNNINPIKDSSLPLFFYIFIWVLLVIVIYLFYRLKIKNFTVKGLLTNHYVYIELSESNQQIGLYRRHQNSTDTIINLANIVNAEIQLNNTSVGIINSEPRTGFTNNLEQDLRGAFIKEHANKMVDERTRQITLVLTDNKNKHYCIYLYLRKGDNRITRKSYYNVIDDLLDLYWLIAQQINADNTEIRNIKKAKPSIIKNYTFSQQNNAELNAESSTEPIVPPENRVQDKVANTQKNNNAITQEHTEKVADKAANREIIDTELVNALERLVRLKQQGFLTEEEFKQAKAKLLKGLLNK
ncbi:MAG: SHOCT domain-containing protein [Colwellia sp.]